jgi:hypothetical protein
MNNVISDGVDEDRRAVARSATFDPVCRWPEALGGASGSRPVLVFAA